MTDSMKGRSSNTRPRSFAGTRGGRASVIWLLIFSVLILLGGIEFLILGFLRIQDAASLSAAPVCAFAQQTGCKLSEQVVVVDRYIERTARTADQVVKVRTPDDNTQIVYSNDHDEGLWSRLQIGDKVKAELWNGSVIRLDDGAGHYIVADDSPEVTSILFPILGAVAVVGGGALLFFSVRVVRRQRKS